jgi:hypothetical protein
MIQNEEWSVTYVSGMDPGLLEAPPGFEPGMEVLQSYGSL